MNVVQPWTVGRYGDLAGVDRWKTEQLVPDLAATAAQHQLYMPVIFPGFSWHNLNPKSPPNQIPRLKGEFLWQQAVNARAAGARLLKIAMFDEVNEGTAMFKTASHRTDAPDQGYWLTLDADGGDLPSDWYLRLAGQITRAFHKNALLAPTLPAVPAKRGEGHSLSKSPCANWQPPPVLASRGFGFLLLEILCEEIQRAFPREFGVRCVVAGRGVIVETVIGPFINEGFIGDMMGFQRRFEGRASLRQCGYRDRRSAAAKAT